MRFIKAKSHNLKFSVADLSVFICAHLLLILVFAVSASAQSGRVKPSETPKPLPHPHVVYVPTETGSENPKHAPKTPSKKETEEGDEGDVISVESNLVPIPVSVLDAEGRAVINLKLEDFQLQIDGKPAEIGGLSHSDTPVRLALLFDNSSSVTTAREFEKKAAIRFFKRVLRPDRDLAALYSVQTATRLEQPLTKNTDQLVQAIENFPIPAGATALLDGIIKAAEYLKESSGRRVIVIVSDGEDTISDATFDETAKAVQSANCQVYVVKTKDFENFKRNGERAGNANIRVLDAERRMQFLAAQTGGEVYSPIDERELDQAFNQVSAELAQQYVLSYYPENESDRRGDFRAISLSVKGRQNFMVRTRKGYYVPKKVIANR
ncbi:MAG: VWA domain-containing protein [Acidobacteriota bacterium]|nr:VWA domain-containing protein [Acidobacteriota bacterium]